MCFAILAAAAEGNHRQSLARIREHILRSVHAENIRRCEFGQISPKSRVTLFLMKKDRYREAFFFLKLCKHIRTVLKRG